MFKPQLHQAAFVGPLTILDMGWLSLTFLKAQWLEFQKKQQYIIIL